MSTAAASIRARPARRATAQIPSWTWRRGAARVFAFALVAVLAAVRFGSLLAHPPVARVLSICLLAVLLAGVLSALGAASGPRASAAASALTAAALCGGLMLAGFPARELPPWHWGQLAHEVSRGVGALNGLWPFEAASQPVFDKLFDIRLV